MAHEGFPWQAQSRAEEPAILCEKVSFDTARAESQPRPLENITNSHGPSTPGKPDRTHGFHHGKRRHGSLKDSPATKNNFRPAPEIQVIKASSRLPVRTIPAWVRDAEEGDLDGDNINTPNSPKSAHIARHHHSLSNTHRPLLGDCSPDQNEEGFPTSSGQLRPEKTSRWMSFARASAYPRENFHTEKVEQEWLDANFTDYSKPWLADHNDDDIEDGSSRYRAFRKKRQAWYKRAQLTVLRNPFIPLVFRLIIITFAVGAIALGASIYHETGKILECIESPNTDRSSYCNTLIGSAVTDYYRDPSALMSVIIDVIAVIYSFYITYDEYFSKPLGLRPARAKVRLVLLDLFFIVFQSANLALSFESLTVSDGACQVGDRPETSYRFDAVCNRAQALGAVLLISLFAWLLTFSVSVLRLVERIKQ